MLLIGTNITLLSQHEVRHLIISSFMTKLCSILDTSSECCLWSSSAAYKNKYYIMKIIKRGAGMEQWWVHSPPKNVAWVDSQTGHCMWVEFVICSRPSFERVFSGPPVFLSLQKPTLPNSNTIWIIVKHCIMCSSYKPVNWAGLVSEISPHHHFFCKIWLCSYEMAG